MLTCEEVSELVGDYLDGRLPQGRRVAVWMHMAICGPCRRYRDQIVTVTRLAKASQEAASAREDGLTPTTRQALLQAFRAAYPKAEE